MADYTGEERARIKQTTLQKRMEMSRRNNIAESKTKQKKAYQKETQADEKQGYTDTDWGIGQGPGIPNKVISTRVVKRNDKPNPAKPKGFAFKSVKANLPKGRSWVDARTKAIARRLGK